VPIWSLRRRTGASPFTGEIPARCEEITREACAGFGAELREFNGETGHAHPLAR
jgi:putative transposase